MVQQEAYKNCKPQRNRSEKYAYLPRKQKKRFEKAKKNPVEEFRINNK